MAAVFAGRERVESAIASSNAVSDCRNQWSRDHCDFGRRESSRSDSSNGFPARESRARTWLVSHAFHSPLMNPVLDEFEKVASNVEYSDPTMGFVSNVTGELADARLIGRADYWRRHAREPVQFARRSRRLRNRALRSSWNWGPIRCFSAWRDAV